MSSVTAADIRDAAQRLAGQVENTPCLHSRTLSAITGAEVWLKFENLQFTASFKERGALNRLLALTDEENRARQGKYFNADGNKVTDVAFVGERTPDTDPDDRAPPREPKNS